MVPWSQGFPEDSPSGPDLGRTTVVRRGLQGQGLCPAQPLLQRTAQENPLSPPVTHGLFRQTRFSLLTSGERW